jgi:hypothetical protein
MGTATIHGGDGGHGGQGWGWGDGGQGGDTVVCFTPGHDTVSFNPPETTPGGFDTITCGTGGDTVKLLGSSTVGYDSTHGGTQFLADSVSAGSGSSTQTSGSDSKFSTGGSSSTPGGDTVSGPFPQGGGSQGFSFDTTQSNFGQGQSTVGSSSQTAGGDHSVSGGVHGSTTGGTVLALDDKTTVKIVGVTHH